MSTYRILAVGMMAAATLTFAGCGQRDYNYKKVETEELKKQVRELEAELAACEARYVDNRLEAAGPHASEPGEQGKITGTDVWRQPMETHIAIEDSILFAPGSAKLTTQAKSTLSRVIELIKKQYPNHYVRVDGHTDTDPVVRSHDKWDDNWDLSGGRAQSVLHFLLDHGIEAKDLGFAGFGEERPRQSGTSAAAKSKNRRVEIVVIPKTGKE
jgi:chemotaxis protein MotB